MQIILSKKEYDDLTSKIKNQDEHISLLKKDIIDLSERYDKLYDKLIDYVLKQNTNVYCNNKEGYCDDCPLGIINLNICKKIIKNYSKVR